MQTYDITLIALIISSFLLLALFVYIMQITNKKQMIYAFLCVIGFAFIWAISNALELFYYIRGNDFYKVFIYPGFLGLCFLPVSLFYVGLIFARTKIVISWKHIFLILLPLLDCVLILTNEMHHLFIKEYAISNMEIVYGKLFFMHTAISYTYLFLGLYFLASSSVKTTGFFSKQSMLIFAGITVPLVCKYTLYDKNYRYECIPYNDFVFNCCASFSRLQY